MKNKFVFLLFLFLPSLVFTQGVSESQGETTNLPLRKVVILTSGLAYYEHSGSLNGAANIVIPFRLEAMNDALGTLVINDSASANPSVTYQSENTLIQTLRSLTVDISDSPDLATILSRLRGAEVELILNRVHLILTPGESTEPQMVQNTQIGRIAGIEYQEETYSPGRRLPYLILNTDRGLNSISLNNINSIKFLDPNIERDLNRALDLISASRNSNNRNLMINLPGNLNSPNTRRNVTISYVIPSPVWKVSYRLDLGLPNQSTRPLFQGWAIVDNDSDTDWNNISLSLVAGRPTSFIQELYPPYNVTRPVLPLSIAGTSEAVTHERSIVAERVPAPAAAPMARSAVPTNAMVAEESIMMDSARSGYTVAGGTIQTAAGADAGGQFEFTIRTPVTLNRRMSAMFPLVEANIEARGVLIYNGTGRHPRLGAEITNTSQMKLPAGPITVYDGGVYAGDALIEFWNEGEKRFISFGEDLAVTANTSRSNTTAISAVSVSGGLMVISNSVTHTRTYTFLNSASVQKQMVIEHQRNPNAELISPRTEDQTPAIYRFNVTLPANRETVVDVNERQIVSQRISLVSQNINSFLSYSTNQEIPANVRNALSRAAELRRAVETAETSVRELEAHRNSLIADQDRIRRNLEAVGNQSSQGQEYLRRLVTLDNEIDNAASNIQRAQNNVRTARAAFENYINGLNLNNR